MQATDAATLQTLRTAIDGGFDEPTYGDRVGFVNLRQHLEAELARRYRDAAPAILGLLEQRAAAAVRVGPPSRVTQPKSSWGGSLLSLSSARSSA